jgi:Zn-dependent protease with chaperone function
MRKSPQRYWLYLAALSFPLAAFLILIQPALIAPLFDDFGPLENRALEAHILELANRAGIDGARVFEVNKSADTNALNAYVTGVLGTKRIVLWDTLLAKLDEREVLFVMGHEMGHYVLHHVLLTTALVSVASFLAFFAGDRLARAAIDRWPSRTGIRGLTDPAALPLLLVVIEALSLFGQPALRAWSRSIERDADQFGLEITRDNHACATAFLKLSETNLANPRPGPLFVFFRASHPPIAERVEYCNDYRPWETGAPLRFGESFRN